MFISFLLNQILKNPNIVTNEMIMDLVKSDAYKNFGSHPFNSAYEKQKSLFENLLSEKCVVNNNQNKIGNIEIKLKDFIINNFRII